MSDRKGSQLTCKWSQTLKVNIFYHKYSLFIDIWLHMLLLIRTWSHIVTIKTDLITNSHIEEKLGHK